MAPSYVSSIQPAPRLTPRVADTDDGRVCLQTVLETVRELEGNLQALLRLAHHLSQALADQRDDLALVRQSLQAVLDSLPAGPNPALETQPELRLFCFGAFEVYLDTHRLSQRRTGKGPAILKYLAARPRHPVQRDVLLEALWPNTEPQVANNRLKAAIHHLRQTFGERPYDYVIFRDGCYLLNPDLRVWTDIEAFESHWRQGRRLERAGQMEAAVPFYVEAEALYRGDYLTEDPFAEWTLMRREELKDIYLTIVDKLSRYWYRTGEREKAGEGWKKILGRDPWREDAYRQLMVCLAGSGQRGQALRWYEVCVQALQEQLGIEPEPETTALADRLRAGLALDTPTL